MTEIAEYTKMIDWTEMEILENYCQKYQNNKFEWKKIEIGYMTQISIKKANDVYIFQSVGY